MRTYFIIVFAVAMATTAMAQDSAAVFAALDSDDNGSVSMAEAGRNTFVMENFEAADSNSDGSLSQEEFETAFS